MNQSFSFPRLLRLSTFQIGSAMGDILVTSIWNRIMIVNFGIPALPVSFLIALRYLLSPLSLWAGFRSDTKPLWGMQRSSYIWLGRGLMVLSLPLLGLSVGRLGSNSADISGWTFATLSSLLYGIGTLISGSPFLALVRDSAPTEKQGLAISTVETVLIIFFAVPPSCPLIKITSAWPLATPAAIVPTPTSDTNFTLIRAPGLAFFRS